MDTTMDVEKARTQLFNNTTTEFIGVNDDIAVLDGHYRWHDFLDYVAHQSNESLTLIQTLNVMTSGEGTWKKLANYLFSIHILRSHQLQLLVTHI
jgi:hypothetical protein